MNELNINELNLDELDTVIGADIVSTVSTVVKTVAATANLVEGLAAAYLNGVVQYEHHLA